MAVDYNDERFQQVDREKEAALNEVNRTYDTMINNSDAYYQSMQNAVNDYKNQQTELQQANTDFAVEQINQQKDWLKKDYEKEQKGAYVDWRKQSNQYGVNAEQMASAGLSRTGYSESSQVSMYNTYQNRVASAREAYLKGVQNYDNGIKEAQLTNNAKLAEIAASALQKNLELALQGFQYKNSLLQSQLAQQQSTSDRYYSRWQDVLNQINTENALAEQQRQFNASLKASSKSGGGSGGYFNGGYEDLFDTNEYQQNYSPVGATTKSGDRLSVRGTAWYMNNFNKHSYQKKDLDYVLREAVNNKQITKTDAEKIYRSYGIKA